MYPYLLRLEHPHIWIGAYGALIGLAVAICFLVAPRWALALEGIDRGTTRRILARIAVATFLGAHLHYLFNAWQLVVLRARAGAVDTLLWTGIHAPGAILGLVVSAPFVVRRYGVPLGRFGDALTPTVGLGIAIARIGCFLNGCCYGTPCAWPWCVAFPEPANVWDFHRALRLIAPDATYSAPVHPLPLYFSAVGLVILAVAFWLHPRKRYDGQVALVALLLFSVTSLALEDLREQHAMRAFWGSLPQLTWTALGMTVGALAGLLAAEIGHRRRTHRRALAVIA